MKILLYALYALVVGNVVAADWNIDIVEGTVNGKKIGTLTLDAVTDTFGRPTDSHQYPPKGIGKPVEQEVLVYADAGVQFMFNSNGGVLVKLYLVDTRDGFESYTQVYTRYKGKLNKGVNGDWKLKKFLDDFKEFEIVKQSDLGAACLKGEKTWLQIAYNTTSGFISSICISSGGKLSDFCNPRDRR